MATFYEEGIALVESKTFWSALLALISVGAAQFNLPQVTAWAVDPNTLTSILNLVAMAASVSAIIFRSTAKAPITSIVPPAPPAPVNPPK